MFSDRVVVRSNTDNHIMFKVFKAYYSDCALGVQPVYDHRHSELEISAILTGSGVYKCSENEYMFRAGDVFMHCGNDNHQFLRIDEELSMVVIQFEPRLIWSGGEWFEPKYLRLFTEKIRINRHIPAESEAAQNICRLLQESFLECCDHRAAYEIVVKAKLLMMLAEMARYYYNEMTASELLQLKVRHIEHIENSMDYILSNLSAPLTLSMLAKEACMSRSYYSTLFKTLNGVSVWNYITAQRVDMAQHLLESTNDSITEICENCGFNNIANFNHTFKRITGKTPSSYRKTSKENSFTDAESPPKTDEGKTHGKEEE